MFHVHSPDIWRNRVTLGLPQTGPEVPYGTPEMAREVKRLYQQGVFQDIQVLAMAGHEDGIISFGSVADETGEAITNLFAPGA